MYINTAELRLQLIEEWNFLSIQFKFLLATELPTHRHSRRLKDIAEINTDWGCSYSFFKTRFHWDSKKMLSDKNENKISTYNRVMKLSKLKILTHQKTYSNKRDN